ncbi:23S rRNA (adenine(2503)-C(2))-methyltransferase RlmN [Hydrogenimonas urashimensis]|uniref:23S rRNA (adenine(2503)-C(2))-methyltransferase RlmN n=1 Tax=Hydrogenimonas urashimensis TaxID=2740515 RepID=UPI001916349F|nr:23S rRNA (adenine(2503)-C(2))-methyltransferase RlmN [Hydrogenimonas urashimensis]
MKPSILDYTQEELERLFPPKFRAKQIYNWVYQHHISDFMQMENVPKKLREELQSRFVISPLKTVQKQKSIDGSIKYLFELQDGHTVEAVLLKMKDAVYDENGELLHHPKFTVCVSSQVGCKVGCAFCLTAKGGFVRNLTAGEIVGQVLEIKKDNDIASNRRVNIVYMGMGEPLDNLDNLSKSIAIFANENGLSISPKRQTVSTSGISSKIKKLGEMELGVQLAISLHAVDDALREELIPMNKAYNIASIIDAVKAFPVNTRKRVMFEYLVIKDVNDDIASAKKLLKLLQGIKSKVNLIYFNPYPGTTFQRPEPEKMKAFQDYLLNRGLLCTIRESKGLDISAACGQLREQELAEERRESVS